MYSLCSCHCDKTPWAQQLIEGRSYFGLCLQREKLYHGGVRHGVWSRKLKRSYFYLQTQSGETKPEVGPGYELSQTLPTEYFLQQDCTISPNSATNWGSSFQIPEPTGNILIQATIHKYPFMHIHVGTHVVLWIHRNDIINAITIKSFICDSSRDSCVFLSIFLQVTQKLRHCHNSSI